MEYYFLSKKKDIEHSPDRDGITNWINIHDHLPLALEFPLTQNIYFFLPVMRLCELHKDIPKLIDAINHEVIENLTALEHKHIGFHDILDKIGLKKLDEYSILVLLKTLDP
jgi:hypothetical protein